MAETCQVIGLIGWLIFAVTFLYYLQRLILAEGRVTFREFLLVYLAFMAIVGLMVAAIYCRDILVGNSLGYAMRCALTSSCFCAGILAYGYLLGLFVGWSSRASKRQPTDK